MGGLGYKEVLPVYEYVKNTESSIYRSACARILALTSHKLKVDHNISSRSRIVGSGARNMITRDGNGPYDLDYNLEILKAPEDIMHNPKKLKEVVRKCLNDAVHGTWFSDSKDSTSVLTCILHFEDRSKVKFSFDVAIVKRNDDGTLMRMIHNKTLYNIDSSGQYKWDAIQDSDDLYKKTNCIKAKGKWQLVRDKYLYLKNLYLERQDNSHPSFIVYVEAVNEIYYKITGGEQK